MVSKTTGQNTPATSARRKRRAPEESMALLTTESLDLFAKNNYSSVTIKDISRSTGINSGLIYYYFNNKSDLFLKTVEKATQEALRTFEEESRNNQTPTDTITGWIQIHATHYIMLQKLAKVSLDYATTHEREDRLDQAIQRFYQKEFEILDHAIVAGMQSGEFRTVEPRQISTFISTFLDGCLFRSFMFPDFDYRQSINDLVDIILSHLKA
ncbi:TetR/AcrR family transcriptional regulator [Acetobacter suratthaniensis]|uniref:TetR/AcrR family transcriptional regulator n=1 Tax=Acetobacter suratthaniensis TaxID=1502841 RepID=A0ABS3LNK8_9PROT|nr:TetR/AcrR family transcriptional regulator [Acetobacter suratthaniensis]MBO1328938.1 TetR/AcrR family transcriptional regulator [Acetobacter suratthaniensis]MCX2567144.1 TetR/AcrR family transcriptional regulator [Acetobacter suratthaniensis]